MRSMSEREHLNSAIKFFVEFASRMRMRRAISRSCSSVNCLVNRPAAPRRLMLYQLAVVLPELKNITAACLTSSPS